MSAAARPSGVVKAQVNIHLVRRFSFVEKAPTGSFTTLDGRAAADIEYADKL